MEGDCRTMSITRGIGYFLAIVLFIIPGFILFPLGLLWAALGFVFIWMLRRSAAQEKMTKYLKKIAEKEDK
jgi:hypothetical protein